MQSKSRFGPQASIISQTLKPGLTGRNNGNLGHGEQAIDENKYKN
jgi:hypothetical protein